MLTKEKFLNTLKLAGFNSKFIKTISHKVEVDADFDELMLLITSKPDINEKTLLHYVSVLTTQN